MTMVVVVVDIGGSYSAVTMVVDIDTDWWFGCCMVDSNVASAAAAAAADVDDDADVDVYRSVVDHHVMEVVAVVVTIDQI